MLVGFCYLLVGDLDDVLKVIDELGNLYLGLGIDLLVSLELFGEELILFDQTIPLLDHLSLFLVVLELLGHSYELIYKFFLVLALLLHPPNLSTLVF